MFSVSQLYWNTLVLFCVYFCTLRRSQEDANQSKPPSNLCVWVWLTKLLVFLMKEVQSVRLHAKGDSDRYENLLDSENTQEVNCIMKGSMRWKLLVFSSLL